MNKFVRLSKAPRGAWGRFQRLWVITQEYSTRFDYSVKAQYRSPGKQTMTVVLKKKGKLVMGGYLDDSSVRTYSHLQ